MTGLKLKVLPWDLTIVRFPPGQELPDSMASSRWSSVTRTEEETSVVCELESAPGEAQRFGRWRALMVNGPLEFSETGVLSSLCGPLAAAGISIFSISTYDTDYVLVQETDLGKTVETLRSCGFEISFEAVPASG